MQRRLKRTLIIFCLLIGIPFVLASYYIPNFPVSPPEQRAINREIGRRGFNFLVWELNAFRTKAESWLVSGAHYLDDEAQQQLVLDYLAIVRDVRLLERDLDRMFAQETDADFVSQELQQNIAEKRAEMRAMQPVAEQILQTQVGEALNAEQFDLLNATWPPVQAHMTPLPLMLIVSPRDDIRQLYAFPLQHGLPVPERDELEDGIFDEQGLSALVVPIGGLGIYPSMVVESSNIVFLSDVIAHEWAHHWLTLQPLGLNYATTSQMRTINETVASVVGTEIGRSVLQTYYPDYLPPEVTAPPVIEENAAESEPEPPRFDFRTEMRETRVRVDELLAEGRLAEAEIYMEQRRLLFVENGFNIRKLNQAYFAFYGAYADEGGATGADPVGPTVLSVRQQSDSLRDFLDTVAPVTSFEQLQAVAEKENN